MKVAPYGSWKSPITSDLIVAQSISLSEVRCEGKDMFWLEGRPQEQGRNVIVRCGPDGSHIDVTPKSMNVRTRVHEYGGGAWTVSQGAIYFSNFADGRLYRQKIGEANARPLTPEAAVAGQGYRFADGVIDHSRRRWIGVREDHTAGGEPVNAIVAVNIDNAAAAAGHVLAGGHDFFSTPRLSPDGRALMWLAWDHPNMPWNGTLLYLADIGEDGAPGQVRVIAGSASESIFQPEWSPDGKRIVFVSDRSGWWNLYSFDRATGNTTALAPMEAEFGMPQWVFGMSTYTFAGAERVVCSYSRSLGRLAVLDLVTGKLKQLETPFTEFESVRGSGNRIVFLAGAPHHPTSIVELDLATQQHRVLKKATAILDQADISKYLAPAEAVEFPTSGGEIAYGLFYPPANPDCAAPGAESAPLLVRCHGGPTSAATSMLNLSTHYWTSRGIAVLDLNYRGSTGYGRAYRDRLYLSWGTVDVDDAVAGARYLAQQGRVDERRCVISGGSAGGYTTLAALTFRDFFQGGASYFGVSDLAALARDTHKFESRYMDWLIGPYPQETERYRERSPLYHTERLSKPVIFFQGEEDVVVPPAQAEVMVEALRRKGNTVGYLLFAGEQHGFRKAETIKRCLDAQLYFYSIEVFRTGLVF
jgi:dipeptidyl aminopeptidase/acylaminoacyl peptidase